MYTSLKIVTLLAVSYVYEPQNYNFTSSVFVNTNLEHGPPPITHIAVRSEGETTGSQCVRPVRIVILLE